ncbi:MULTISPECIES: type II secretion system F family protein [Cupriavidus]|jgi:type II secretory pathway component PulF|uniref:type II secretion system F family protein n=1 Tax=Cupriavidus TaxID=106589 RepID=UPI00046607E9|nr:type II secretion system F family protein [Cupriavidus metallidurans]KWW32353.1 Toxin coregulated pilus biosynthesis protein E [Cupriavidus metallidurans]
MSLNKASLGMSTTKQMKAAKRVRLKKPRSFWAKVSHFGDELMFGWSVRQGLYRHLSAQVGNTVPVETALDNYRRRLQRRKQVTADKIVGDISRRMRDGSTLAKALSNWIPADEVSIISSGELSGSLAKSLDLLVESKRRIANVMKTVKSSMTRPLIYSVAIYAFVWVVGRFVIPDLQFALPEERARGLVAGMFVTGRLANSWVAIIPPVIGQVLLGWIAYSLPRWEGRRRVAFERYFPYNFYRDIHGYAWLMGFTALLRAGMPDVTILKNQLEHASPWLHERLHALWWRMDNGSSLPAALMAEGTGGMPPFGFPNPDIIDDIDSMAGFSDFPERISKVASIWAEDLEESTRARAARFGFWAEMVMYGLMALLMLAVNAMSDQLANVPAA